MFWGGGYVSVKKWYLYCCTGHTHPRTIIEAITNAPSDAFTSMETSRTDHSKTHTFVVRAPSYMRKTEWKEHPRVLYVILCVTLRVTWYTMRYVVTVLVTVVVGAPVAPADSSND